MIETNEPTKKNRVRKSKYLHFVDECTSDFSPGAGMAFPSVGLKCLCLLKC